MCSTFPNFAATSQNVNWEMSHWNGLPFHKALEHTNSLLYHPLSFDTSVHCLLMLSIQLLPFSYKISALMFTNCLSALINKPLLKLLLNHYMAENPCENTAVQSGRENKLCPFSMCGERNRVDLVISDEDEKSVCECLRWTYNGIRCGLALLLFSNDFF